MALVNVSVYCITSKMTLLSRRILSSDDPDATFRALFRERLKPTIGQECELEKVYVGRDKVCLDVADMNLNVGQVTAVFGSFIKYTVKTVQDSTSSTVQHLMQNAFEIMFQSQRRLAMQTLPARVNDPKNRKQKLRNDILDLLDQNNVAFKHCEVTSVGEQIIQALTNTLIWYVDGHYEVLRFLVFLEGLEGITYQKCPSIEKGKSAICQVKCSNSMQSNFSYACKLPIGKYPFGSLFVMMWKH